MDANQITLEEALHKLAASEAQAEQLGKDLTAERELRGKAEQELLDANTLIDALNQAVGEQPEDASAPTVTLGTGKQAQTYRFTVPQFHFAGYGVVVAAEVESNSDVLQALVKAGAKVLELVPAQ